ncbi:MAG: glycosyltransferase family 4 protein [Fibrobacterales bacterium]|nr:glycosyltransferase family 4 protein [Fibrobacterales bacterium]MBP5351881.1 glycosyltransferase family 4 protein [Fibrobacterales bacterium]
MLILNWRDRLHPRAGGAEVHLHEIYSRLVRTGTRVVLFSCAWPGCPEDEVVDGIEVHRLGSDATYELLCMKNLRRWIRETGADMVVEDFNKLPYFAPVLSTVPVLVQMHHLWRGSIFREASFPVAFAVWAAEQTIRLFYRKAEFCVVSASTAGELAGMGIPRDRIAVVHNGLDHGFYSPAEPEAARAGAAPFVLWLGRLQRYKGVLDALESFALVRGRFPGLRLKVAGSGPFRPEAEKRARALGIGGDVDFLGFVPQEEKLALLRGAEFVLQTSRKEGWGLTVVEANACGRTVVAADSPGLRDSVRDGETGLLYEPGNVEALAAAQERLLSDPGLRKRLEEAALLWAERFTWEGAADATREILERIAGGAR